MLTEGTRDEIRHRQEAGIYDPTWAQGARDEFAEMSPDELREAAMAEMDSQLVTSSDHKVHDDHAHPRDNGESFTFQYEDGSKLEIYITVGDRLVVNRASGGDDYEVILGQEALDDLRRSIASDRLRSAADHIVYPSPSSDPTPRAGRSSAEYRSGKLPGRGTPTSRRGRGGHDFPRRRR